MPKKSGLVTQREKEIGRRIKRFREQINWPQPAFAAELEISRDRLASIEYGRTPLRYDIGYRLCFIFDVSHQWLAAGAGETRAATAAAELPVPEGQPPHALFSEVWDKARKHAPASPAKKAAAAHGPEDDLIPGFDAAEHVGRFMADLFAREKFPSPLERQEFALEVTSFARELALRLRRGQARDRSLSAAERRPPASPQGRLASKLQSGIDRLEREINKLAAAMNKLNPVAVDPSALPAAVSDELARCQEAIDKIAGQIEEAEGKLRALASRRSG